jgi:NADH dehydrogenase
MNIPDSKDPRIVVIGGGFGGMSVTRKLLNKPVQLVLIDKRNYHTFQPLLYQVSTSGLEPDSIAFPLRKFLNRSKNGYFRMAEVNQIHAEKHLIETNIGTLNYDYLVIATGSKTNFFGNENVEKNAVWMKTVPQALNLRSLIFESLEQAAITEEKEKRKALLTFVIAGAGPTGVELSGAIAELRNHIIKKDYKDFDASELEIHLIEGANRVLPPMSEESSADAHKYLTEMGVQIHLETMVKDYKNCEVTTNNGKTISSENFIWSAGVHGAPVQGLKAESLIDRANRYKVNTFNQVEGYENVFAIGDIALMHSEDYPKGHPMVAQPAIQQGRQLAKNILNIIKGEKLQPFEYNDKGSMATIGRNKAVVDIGKFQLGGFIAWYIWMFVHLWFLIGIKNRLVTFLNWVYNYINYDRSERLIIRPFKRNRAKMEDVE